MNYWKQGLPPRDGRVYAVRQVLLNAGGHRTVEQSTQRAFWHKGGLYRRSQFHGGLVPVLLTNRWRVVDEQKNQHEEAALTKH